MQVFAPTNICEPPGAQKLLIPGILSTRYCQLTQEQPEIFPDCVLSSVEAFWTSLNSYCYPWNTYIRDKTFLVPNVNP